MKLKPILLCGVMVLATAVSAAADAPSTQIAPSGVHYIMGGIGDGEQSAFDAQRKNFNLRLTFVQKNGGAYVADVQVVIRNSSNAELLNVVSPGPFLFAQLPAGSYQISASYSGEQQSKRLAIKQPSSQIFYFNEE